MEYSPILLFSLAAKHLTDGIVSFNPDLLRYWTIPDNISWCFITSATMSTGFHTFILPTPGQEPSNGVGVGSQL